MTLNNKLKEYITKNPVRFHMPGHKGRSIGQIDLFGSDITEIEGFDDLFAPKETILKINERLAKFFEVKRANLLVNGTTSGIMSCIFSLIKESEKVLLPRNSHKSVYNAIMLRHADPIYYYPEMDENGISYAVDVESAKCLLDENPTIKLTVLTSPTYEGVVSSVKDISSACRERGVKLLVDAAHGAHFDILEQSFQNPVRDGADVCVTSLHKSLPFLTQTSCILRNSDDSIFEDNLCIYEACFQTSSPSYVFMAEAEMALEYLERKAAESVKKTDIHIKQLKKDCNSLENIQIYDRNDLDPWKLVLTSTKQNGASIIYKELRNDGIEPEMHTPGYCLLMTSLMNVEEDFKRLTSSLKRIDKVLRTANSFKGYSGIKYPKNEMALRIHEAIKRPYSYVEYEASEGRISRGFVEMFPPGIPLIVPGEIIKKSHIDLVKNSKELNINIRGIIEGKIPVI